MSRPEPTAFDIHGQRIVGVGYSALQPSGAPVMLTHGFSVTRMGVGHAFVDFARRLTNGGVAVYASDRLGHGNSDGPFEAATVPGHLLQFIAMLDFAEADGDGPMRLMGYSLVWIEAAVDEGQRPENLLH